MLSEPSTGPGVRSSATWTALASWTTNPWPIVRRWLAGSALATALLLVGTLVVAELVGPGRAVDLGVPPVSGGGVGYALTILGHNLLVLALHCFACIAGFIAGARLPAQAAQRRGLDRRVHEYGARLAIAFVLGATLFSLGNQVWDLGTAAAGTAHELHTNPALLLATLLPHAAPELLALFLPLAAWVSASRAGRWGELLAAALVTTALAIPILLAAATWESFGAPHLVALLSRH